MTDVADVQESAAGGRGSPRITAEDRALLLRMLERDELAHLFRQIVTEDFGSAAATEMFGECLSGHSQVPGAESSGLEF